MPSLKDIQQKLRTGNISELARGSFRSFLLRIAGIGVTYLFTVSVTRLMGSDVYGAFMLAQTVLMVSLMVARMGSDRVILRWVSSLRATGRKAEIAESFKSSLRLVLPLSVLMIGLVWVLAPWVGHLLIDRPGGASFLRWMVLGILPMALLFLTSEALRGLKRVEEAMTLRNVIPFGIGLLFLFLIQGNGTVLVPVRSYLIGMTAASALGLFLWWWHNGWNGVKGGEGSNGPLELMKVGFPFFLSSSMFLIMNWADLMMLGYFLKDQEVGVYSVAMRVANLNNVALYAVNMIAAPKFSEKYAQGDMEGLNRLVRRATNMVFAVVLPLVLLIVLWAAPILSLFGSSFQAGYFTLILLALGKFVNAASGSVMYFLQMTGREKVGQYILMGAVVANIGLNLALIPTWGIEGAALASAISVAGWNIYGGIYIWRHYRILTFFQPFFSPKKPRDPDA
ncbi:MAG: flippase [Flavobacteriales bacterium]